MWKIISNAKDWLVKDNFGLHLGLTYILFDYLNIINLKVAFIVTFFFIILVEIFDKYILKTKFSTKDILAGLIGMILAYLSNIL